MVFLVSIPNKLKNIQQSRAQATKFLEMNFRKLFQMAICCLCKAKSHASTVTRIRLT